MPRRKNTRPTFIYWLIDTRSGTPFYCGKTVNPPHQRLQNHKYEAAHGTRSVHARVRDCGEHIRIHVMETVSAGGDWSAREKRWILLLRQMYTDACNTADGGAGAPGWVPSEETRRKITEANLGRKHSAETRAKISKFLTGRKWSRESVEKMRESKRGYMFSDEHRANISKSKKGRPGRPHTPEQRAKISAANKGRRRSAETLLRMSIAQKKAHNARLKTHGICPSTLLSLPC